MKIKTLWHNVINSNTSTREVADGAAIGVFIGFSPTIGLHTLLIILLTVLLKKNKWVALLAGWICNPLTVIPMFLLNYWIGELFYPQTLTFNEVKLTLMNMDLAHLKTVGVEILIPIFLGSLVTGVVFAWLARHLCLRHFDKFRRQWRRRQKPNELLDPLQ